MLLAPTASPAPLRSKCQIKSVIRHIAPRSALTIWLSWFEFNIGYKPERRNFTKQSALGTHCSIILPNFWLPGS